MKSLANVFFEMRRRRLFGSEGKENVSEVK